MMMITMLRLPPFFFFLSFLSISSSFLLRPGPSTMHHSLILLSTGAVSDSYQDELALNGLYKRDCYVATNRFAVRKDKQATFEKRWATRKSRLAVLTGFRYFHLMRRVSETGEYDEGDSDEAAQENYVSFTIWDKKSDFSAWRKGDAFKEAHGGTSIVSFLSTMVNSALVLRGAPRPAFYDGLFLDYTPVADLPDVVDGWRNVEADGIATLPAECQVQMVKYFVDPVKVTDFEKEWKACNDKRSNGHIVARTLLRRDGQAKGHGVSPMDSSEPTYIATTIFQTKDAASNHKEEDNLGNLCRKPAETVRYEGTLMLTPMKDD